MDQGRTSVLESAHRLVVQVHMLVQLVLGEPWPSVAQFLGSIVGRGLGPCRTWSRHGRLLDHSGCICRQLEDSGDRSTFLAVGL